MATSHLHPGMGATLQLDDSAELPLTPGERWMRIALLLGFGAVLAIEAYLLLQVLGLIT